MAPSVATNEVVQWKQDTLEGLGKGSRVWFKGPNDTWCLGTLSTATDSKDATVALDAKAGESSGQSVTCPLQKLVPANPSILDGVPNLTNLSYLNEPSILHALHQRYTNNDIYTHAGPVLIAINPFKRVPLYGPETVQRYKAQGAAAAAASAGAGGGPSSSSSGAGGSGDPDAALPPHVFLTADAAYRAMCRGRRSQSLVISGESGAGKTETTKVAMQYLAGLAGGSGVEEQVLQTNPLLEAFGNARTLRNNNSSRFGKLIEIYFNAAGHICGALIQTYLLEKSRVVHQLPGERNYHIFYQLCKGSSPEEQARFRLPRDPLATFRYLNASGCTEIPGVDDAQEFVQMKRAMKVVGIAEDEQSNIFELLAAILWLGNVQFSESRGDEGVEILPGEALGHAAALLRCPPGELTRVLTQRRIMAGGETIVRALGREAAAEARDALAKAAYHSLFKWLVELVNAGLGTGKRRTDLSLSILDIYGFECFPENSFEQLCINYANERLQQQFNRHLFKLEQEAYESEGINWEHVEFVDNQVCVDLIDSRPPRPVGILSLLDEECLFPKASDDTFGAKLRNRLSGTACFSFNPKSPNTDFCVQHYAGPVVYRCHNFLDKNKDALSPDLVELMLRAEEPLLVRLAQELAEEQKKRGSQTVATRFRDQLRELMARLDQTELHFVRCIKPNSQQVAGSFSPALVLHQLRCCGVLEVARIARAGYPTRYAHAAFAERYCGLLRSADLKRCTEALEVCRLLLAEFRVPAEQYQIGRTKLFFRAGVLGQLEDHWARVQRSVQLIQSTLRMLWVRRPFLHMRRCAVLIQARQRGRRARAAFVQLRARHRAAVVLQTTIRGYQQRRRYEADRARVVRIQMAVRRWRVQRRVARREAVRREKQRLAEAVRRAQVREAESFDAIKAEFGMSNGEIRGALLQWRAHGQQFLAYAEAVERGDSPAHVATASTSDPSHMSGNSPDMPGRPPHYSQVEATPGKFSKEKYEAEWEEYSEKLEEQVRLLMEDNARLQAALATRPPDDMSSGGIGRGVPKPLSAPSEASGDLINAWQEDRSYPLSDTPRPAVPVPGSAARAAVASGQKYVAKLAEELERKQALFEDDVAFIREVAEGAAEAPGMSPDQELRTLKLRFDAFRRDFKVRLADTAMVLKRVEKEEKKNANEERRQSGGGERRLSKKSMLPGGNPALDRNEPDADGSKKKRGLLARISMRKSAVS